MSREHLELGQQGESAAAAYLKRLGHKILARNFSCAFGELDLVTLHECTLIFVEVKTLQAGDRHPEDAVGKSKRRKLSQLANYFIKQQRLDRYPCRFDVIAVRMDSAGRPTIEHFPDAFQHA